MCIGGNDAIFKKRYSKSSTFEMKLLIAFIRRGISLLQITGRLFHFPITDRRYIFMKTNVSLISSLRQPFRSFLLLTLIGLITFGFITKAVGFILVQRETGVLGSYYRSIGILENIKDPQSGDISAGIDLIETSPYLAYGDQREIVSGVMQHTYNANDGFKWTNSTLFKQNFPEEQWPYVHATDIWFLGELIQKEDAQVEARDDQKITLGYYLKFKIDTVLAAYPENAAEGRTVGLLFMFEGNEAAIPTIQEMETGQRYLIRCWEDPFQEFFPWNSPYNSILQIIPLDDEQLWYVPMAKGASIDFNDPGMTAIKNKVDILNENLHTLNIVATADLSAMPKTQESARFYYLTAGRWLNHQDDLDRNKVIVMPENFAAMRGFELGDEIQLTFRPLQNTFLGYIRDGVDSDNWRNYPTYQDTFTIVGLYARTTYSPLYAYIPTHSLRSGFTSSMQGQFTYENDYSFVLDSSRHEAEFVQEYKAPLQELGINLTFLENNGPAYWAAVDPIRRSSSADLLVFGLLLVVALILAVFLYQTQRKRDYAILRALGVPSKQANIQLIWPLLLSGGLGIILGGLPAWNYALDQAKVSLSTLPTPAGVSPSADLSLFVLFGLCAAIFLLLALFSWLGVFFLLSNKPVYELLQGETSQYTGRQKQTVSDTSGALDLTGDTRQESFVSKVDPAARSKYTPASLSRYVIHHILRSRLKSILNMSFALVFLLAMSWIRQTMERSQVEVDHLYETTVIEADILQTGSTTSGGKDFISRDTIDNVLQSGFVNESFLEAESTWAKIETINPEGEFPGPFQVYAYDSSDAFHSGLSDPGSITFSPGWDMDIFLQPRTLEEIREGGLPALFPASLLAQLQVNVGETVRIKDRSNRPYTCVIVGQYSGLIGSNVYSTYTPRGGNYILVPLSTLESMEGAFTRFTAAHFVLDPTKNRELPQLHAETEKVMKVYIGKFRFVVWDEELRIVIGQLERNLSLLRVLYPVVIAVSVLIGAGLCFLLLLQRGREAAILRVLGATRTAVRLVLVSEPLCLSILGVVIGLAISRFLWMTSGLVSVGALLTGAGLYLAGALAGSVTGAILITNKMPIELLQVKE
jgi:ABC-type antimicrobial peptide transport system permease subunit